MGKHDFNHIIQKQPQRSKFLRAHKHTTSFNVGELIPIQIDEILPGDNINLDILALVRQTTMIKPVMDGLHITIHTFNVPTRLIWDDQKYFFGENDNPWYQTEITKVPLIQPPKGGWNEGTIADYLGQTPGIENYTTNHLPFRAYCKIVADWYRDENLQTVPFFETKTPETLQGTNGREYVKDLQLGGYPFIAGKCHDYFTSALPGPQKGEAPLINIGGTAPVTITTTKVPVTSWSDKNTSGEIPVSISIKGSEVNNAPHILFSGPSEGSSSRPLAVSTDTPSTTNLYSSIQFDNLWANTSDIGAIADLSKASGININELRNLITIQQMLELDARNGTRYTEYIKGHFGVDNGDIRLQRSEYLGGTSIPLNVQQVPQTSQSTEEDSLADLGAYGQTGINEDGKTIRKTFTEHGYLITMACVRYNHTYQQGIEPLWNRRSKYDFYDPIFANIGEQPIKNKEIFNSGKNTDEETFGFKEAWTEYRYKPNRTSGAMRSTAKESLDIWHYGDNYKELPKLSDEWIQEDKSNVDRTLAISSDKAPQIQADFWFTNYQERPIPVESIPGLKKL